VSLTRTEASRLFLRKEKEWPLGGEAMPVDQVDEDLRERFTRAVHQRSLRAVLFYWQQLVFSGREKPPPAVGSDAEMVSYVAHTRGAIGYVSVGAQLDGVKPLRLAIDEVANKAPGN
jgi:ABC-type phosphate transport system substrate-binding protein